MSIRDSTEALLAHADAEADLESNAGSVGRRLDDVRSETGSSGPSQPAAAQESPFVGTFSSHVTMFPSTPTPMAAPTILGVFSAGRGVHILDQIGNLNAPYVSSASAEAVPRVSSASAGAAPGLSCAHPAVRSPITASLSASAETTATDPSSITVSGVHHGQQVSQADRDLDITDETGRGHSIWRKSWTPGSALPLHATSRLAVPHDGGSSRITDGVSSLVHRHHAHPGPKEHYIGDDGPRDYGVPPSVPLPHGARSTGQPGVGILEYVDPSYVMTASAGPPGMRHSESRIAVAFPQFNGPEKGCNDWTIAKNPAGSPRAPRIRGTTSRRIPLPPNARLRGNLGCRGP